MGLSELPEALTQAFTRVDYHDHFALVAESFAGGFTVQRHPDDARLVRVQRALSAR